MLQNLITSLREQLQPNKKLSYFLIYFSALMIIGSVVYVYCPMPPDDFLRHIRHSDYSTLGGYAYMFPNSFFGSFDFNVWYGFDLFAGYMKNLLGSEQAIIFFEILFVCLFFIAILLNLKEPDKNGQDFLSLNFVLVFFLMSYSLYRITLIRPSIFIGIIFLMAIKGRGFLTGVLFSSFSAFFYYLFFLYSLPLAAAHFIIGRKRYSTGIFAGSLISIIVWALLTNFDYFRVVSHLVYEFTGRQGIVIQENVFSVGKLTNPLIFVIVLLFASTVYRSRKLDIYLLLILLTLPLTVQVRYFLDISLPLMVIYISHNSDDLYEYFQKNKRIFEAAALFSILLVIPPLTDRSIENNGNFRLEGISVPKGSVVYADGMPLNFSLVYWNKEPVRVIPSAAISWNDTNTKELMKSTGKWKAVGQRFCDYAEKHSIEYLITENIVSDHCVTHIKTFNKGRRVDLWKVTLAK